MLLAAIGVLIAVLFPSGEEQPEQSAVSVFKLPDADVRAMKITTPDNVVDVVKKDGIWSYRNEPDAELDQSSMESALTMVCYLYAREQLFDSVEDISVYGLDPAQMLVELELADGSRQDISFGSYTSYRDAVFMKHSGSDAVYLYDLDSYSILQKAAESMRDLTIDIDADSLVKIEIMRTDGERVPVTMELIPEKERVALETWKLVSPFDALANGQAVSLVQNFFASPRFAAFCGDEVLDEYGFGTSSAYIYLEEEDGNCVRLNVGARTESGKYYCMQEGRKGVYELASGFESLFKLKDENIFPGVVFPLSAEERADVCLYVTNDIYILAEAQSKGYTLNDNMLSDAVAEELYEKLAGLKFAGVSKDADISGGPYAEISLKNGENSLLFSFYEYRNEFYAVCLNGSEKASGYVAAADMKELISGFNKAANG